MKIFQLEENKVYRVMNSSGSFLNRRFRVKNNKLENDGLGRFSPCDWVPMNSKMEFIEVEATSESIVSRIINYVSSLLNKSLNSDEVSFLQLKENIVYSSNSLLLPKLIYRKDDELLCYETNIPLNNIKLSLDVVFKEQKAMNYLKLKKELNKTI